MPLRSTNVSLRSTKCSTLPMAAPHLRITPSTSAHTCVGFKGLRTLGHTPAAGRFFLGKLSTKAPPQ
eukprot:4212284-Pyramimonas_sp.AAC.1